MSLKVQEAAETTGRSEERQRHLHSKQSRFQDLSGNKAGAGFNTSRLPYFRYNSNAPPGGHLRKNYTRVPFAPPEVWRKEIMHALKNPRDKKQVHA